MEEDNNMLQMFRGPITGPKFFLIFSSFFVVIISVNLVLAFKAVATFPGLEVKNSYVASQNFDDDRAAQLALGWDVSAYVTGENLHLVIRDAAGAPVEVAQLDGVFGRATNVQDDQIPAFVYDGQDYIAPVMISGGNWNLRFEAIAQDGTVFKQRVVVLVE
jgi:nitrogen fixation protein FixH